MNSFNFNNGNNHTRGENVKSQAPMPPVRQVRNPYGEAKNRATHQKNRQNPVISGYFVREKSYKEIIISRMNTALCCILGCLVLICLVSYYFVVENEIELRKLSKETIALNYDNSDMQNKLDNLQSLSNVDLQVSKTNILQRAKQVIELSAASLPDVNYDKSGNDTSIKGYLGY